MNRRLILILSLVFAVTTVFSQTEVKIGTGHNIIKVEQLSPTHLQLKVKISDLRFVPEQTPSGLFYQLESGGMYKVFGKGKPMLPVISKIFDLPAGAKVSYTYRIDSVQEIDLNNYITGKLMPAQEEQRKSQIVRFVYDTTAYEQDKFFKDKFVKVNYYGRLRQYRLWGMQVSPFAYNPKRNKLLVYSRFTVDIRFVGADWSLERKIERRYDSKAYNFSWIISNKLPQQNKQLLNDLPLTLIIVTPDSFLVALKPYIELKEKQGYNVVIFNTSQIGSSREEIYDALKNYYYSADKPQDYVLFVGDVDVIPSWPQRTIDQHVTDLYYCEYTGDYLPEVMWGRFSADNVQQLEAIVQKVVSYETLQLPSLKFLNQVLLVPGNDEQHEDTYGNGQIRYGVTYYFNSSNGIYAHVFYQDPPEGDTAVHDSIIADIDSGVAFANYTAHCSPNGWYDPSFSREDLPTLTNFYKYGLWLGNCCQSNKFDEEDAFSEEALYLPKRGAVTYIGASDYSYWDEDYWWAVGYTSTISAYPSYDSTGEGAYDGYFHTMPNEAHDRSRWYITADQIVWAGNLAVEQSPSTLKQYYWEIYQVMGDPTLIPYIGTLKNIQFTSQDTIRKGQVILNLLTSPNIYVTVFQDGQVIGRGLSDTSGFLQIGLSNMLIQDSVEVYAYGQNYKPLDFYIKPKPPTHAVVYSWFKTDSVLAPATDDTLYIYVTNLSSDSVATDVSLNLSGDLHLVKDSFYFSQVLPQDTILLKVPYNLRFVPDGSSLNFRIYELYNSGSLRYSCLEHFKLTAKSPQINILAFDLFDNNMDNVVQSTEKGYFLVRLTNTGHNELDSAVVKLQKALSGYIEIFNNPQIIRIKPKDTLDLKFDFVADSFEGDTSTDLYANLYYRDSIFNNSVMKLYLNPPKFLQIGKPVGSTHMFPFYNYWRNELTEILVKQPEYKYVTGISRIGFLITKPTSGGYTFYNMKLKIIPTTAQSLSLVDTSEGLTVFQRDTLTIPGDSAWYVFKINPWKNDYKNNLVIAVFWGQNPSYVSSETDAFNVAVSVTNYTSVVYQYYDSTPLETDKSNSRPVLRLYNSAVESIAPAIKVQKISIFPNPAHEHIIIANIYQPGALDVRIYNLSGQLIKRSTKTIVNISGLKPGVYIVRVMTKRGLYVGKFIKI